MTDPTCFERQSASFRSDVGLYYCGERKKSKNHKYGPEIRNNFLIVLVQEGKAVLHADSGDIRFGSGDILVMFPGELVFYEALTDWSIKWIGVSASELEKNLGEIGVTRKKPVIGHPSFSTLSDIVSRIFDICPATTLSAEYRSAELLNEFFAEFFSVFNRKISVDPVWYALRTIKYNYNNDISVSLIARSLFLDESYFSRLFKKEVGISPKQYIMKVRLEKARDLLKTTDFSIKEIARSTGFTDQLYFSRSFSRAFGSSPTAFRQNK